MAQPATLPPDLTAELPPLAPLGIPDTAPAPAPLVPPAELAAPLGSLDSVAPPAALPPSSDPKLPDIRYRLQVEGLKAIGLEARFRDLSALLDKGRKAGSAAQVSARADADVQTVENLLRSEGYFDAVASAVVGPLPEADGQLLVAITATPGRRYSLGTITVTGGATPLAPEPLALSRQALTLKTGDPIVAPVVEGAEASVALRLPEQGYPFVAIGQRDILLDDVTFTGDYTLPVTAGRKARFGGFRLAGDPVFDAKHIGILPRFKPGEIYDSRRVDDLRQALVATSLLSTVSVEPVATGTIDAEGIETVDLLVRQSRGPARNLAANAGYGTGEGVRVSASWTHRNLFPPEGALSAAVVAGTNEQSIRGQFIRSNAGQRDRTFQAGASVARQRYDAFNAETININASLSRVSTPIWQKRWTWSLGGELIASRETSFDPLLAERDRGTYLIAALPTQLGYDRSDSLLDPTRGFRLTARVSPEAQKRTGGSFDSYGRFLFEASAYYPITSSIVIAGRARVGSIVGAPRDEIAPSRRLYAGGGGSVRGFGFQELGPRDLENKPIGGRGLTEFALEARYRFGDFGIVPFIDAGRLGESSTPSLSGMRYGVGIGGRYYTNFGPMRIDIATPINRRPGESKVALYISIGQAF
ncbi:autotransporter assembly complex protein TamA [Sandarakinorhabdus sp. DWP1-3-1]|uniref:autotransporter assembly complex protein TamA n=1 Tax=Sandarakinorhabdus sp. DWP1-3-1 TaxID=2804627 RepID=UPI003CF28E56